MAKTTETKQELILVDPKEFGIEQDKAIIIANSFSVKQTELLAYQESYNEIITSELTPELSKKAKELGNKLVKVRTGIAAIHKVEKAFYLAGGKFVDALKNKLTMNVEQMEEKLEEIEQHFVKIEADRKAKLKADRLELLLPYDVLCVEHFALDEMSEDQFNGLLETNKTAFEAKKEQERLAELARIEAEKKAEQERAEAERLEAERIEDQRLENERLKAEIAEKEAIRKKRFSEMQPMAIMFRDFQGVIELPEEEYQKQLAEHKIGYQQHLEFKQEQEQKEFERNERLRIKELREIEEAAKIKAKKELEEKEKARIEAEQSERKAKEKAALLAPDKDKVKAFGIEFAKISFPELSSKEGKIMAEKVKTEIEKLKAFINSEYKLMK